MVERMQLLTADANTESVDQIGRAYSEKLQVLARTLLSSLYMLTRSVKMYDSDNAVFEKPLHQLLDSINSIITRDGKLELLGVKSSFYLNGMLVKVDVGALDNVIALLEELRSHDVGGFTLTRSVTVPELKNFIEIFRKEQTEAPEEDGLAGKKLVAMKLAKWSKLKLKLANEKTEADARVDRKKYAMTCYGRAVVFVRKYMQSLQRPTPISTSGAVRVVQDLIDIADGQRAHFLGMSSMRVDSEYLVYHQVNTCLMSIVFGVELGLTKNQLRDLGYIALFHDVGMATVPDAWLAKKGALTAEEMATVAKAPLIAARNILKERSINRSTLLRLVATFEHKAEFGTAVRDNSGNIQMIIPRASLGVYSKIIAICATFDALCSKRPFRDAYGPEVALMLMWTEMRNKFDPELLKVFMRVMAIAPVKLLTKRQQNLSIGVV
jgi:HD-GYP domain-containing protein (c-di-GMP phosphodiesterase class II)